MAYLGNTREMTASVCRIVMLTTINAIFFRLNCKNFPGFRQTNSARVSL